MKKLRKKDVLDKDEYYESEEGFIVFTEKHHLKRGYCCDNKCKHCPYIKKNTQEITNNK